MVIEVVEKEGIYYVLSKTRPKYYKVDLDIPFCQCKGFEFRGTCSHIEKAKEFRKKANGG